MSVIRIMNGEIQSSSQDDVQVIQADLSHLTLNSLVDVTYTTPGAALHLYMTLVQASLQHKIQ